MGIPFSQVPTWDDRTPIYVISVAAELVLGRPVENPDDSSGAWSSAGNPEK